MKVKRIAVFLLLTVYLCTSLLGCVPLPMDRNSKFSGDCGIQVTASISTLLDSGNFPTVTVDVTNTSNQDIHAIKMYIVPFDVYDDEVTGLLISNEIFLDTTLAVGSTASTTHVFANDSIRTAKIYVYSVYFADQTEWGDRDSSRNTIIREGYEVTVSGRTS